MVSNNVLEHGELTLGALTHSKRLTNYYSISLSIASSFRGSRYSIDLKYRCWGDNKIWCNNVKNCDDAFIGGEAPKVVFARRYSWTVDVVDEFELPFRSNI